MDKIETQRRHFEGISDKYFQARQAKTHLLYKKLLWHYFFRNKDFLKKKGMLVLEPMCGYAGAKAIIGENLTADFEYQGFDYSEIIVDKVKRQNPKVNIFRAEITKFRPAKKYDLVIILGGLHHVYDYARQIVGNIYDFYLKEGGYFINFEATQNNCVTKKIRKIIYARNPLFDNKTEKAFDLQELNTIYLTNHFEIVDQLYPGLICYVLYYNPEAFPLLNIGGKAALKLLFTIDKLFFRNFIGKKLSFATLSLIRKR